MFGFGKCARMLLYSLLVGSSINHRVKKQSFHCLGNCSEMEGNFANTFSESTGYFIFDRDLHMCIPYIYIRL